MLVSALRIQMSPPLESPSLPLLIPPLYVITDPLPVEDLSDELPAQCISCLLYTRERRRDRLKSCIKAAAFVFPHAPSLLPSRHWRFGLDDYTKLECSDSRVFVHPYTVGVCFLARSACVSIDSVVGYRFFLQDSRSVATSAVTLGRLLDH